MKYEMILMHGLFAASFLASAMVLGSMLFG